MRTRRWTRPAVSIGLSIAIVVIACGGSARAARYDRTAARNVQSAAASIGRIPRASFAVRRRAVVLSKARRATSLVRTSRTCAALAAADDLRNALATPATWRGRRIPRGAVRRPTMLLTSAETRLMRRAGRRCATTAKVTVVRDLHTGGSGLVPLPGPTESNEQGVTRAIPAGSFRRAASIGAATGLGAGPFGQPASGARAFAAAQPLTLFRTTDLGAQTCCGTPQEPTAAIGKGVVWYTGNSMVALSTDAGRTFQYFAPSTLLPDAGLPFCCDQIVSYSSKYNLFVWLMQYWCAPGTSSPATNICTVKGTGANRIRIAYATPQSLIAHSLDPGKAWVYWDMTPQKYGEPANAWFDRSSMSLGDDSLNVQVDILRGASGHASLLARVPLSDLAGASSSVHTSFGFDSSQRMEAVQGPGDITYFAGASSLSRDRIDSWEPYTSNIFVHEIDHSSIPSCAITATGSNGGNWYDRFGIWPGGVESATLSGSTLYVAHGTGRAYCGDLAHPLFAQPAIFVGSYSLSSWKKTGEKWMWHPTLALGYPAMQTDAAGDVGIAYRAAASGQNPFPVASFFTPNGESVVALPAGGAHEAGDYYGLRPGETPHSFVMTAITVVGGVKHWDYIEYGRGPAPYVAPPDVTITAPKDGANVDQGTTVFYAGLVYDPVWGSLPTASVVWTEDGAVFGHGPQITHTESVAGAHTITLTATNGDGKSASRSITVNVQAPPPAGAPIPTITSPADSTTFYTTQFDPQPYAPVAFQATATDPNVPPQALSYSWTDSVNGGPATVVSTALSPTLNLHYDTSGGVYTATTHDLTLTVTNTSGKSGSKKLRVYVSSNIG